MNMNITHFSINPDVVYTLIDNEAVLMRTEDYGLYGMNNLGTEILKQLEQKPMSLPALCEYLLNEFDVEEDQCMKDTQLFLDSLLAENLIIKM